MAGKYEKNRKSIPVEPPKNENPPKKKWGLIIVLAVVLLLVIAIGGVALFLWSKLDLIQFDNEVDYDVYATEQQETAPEEGEETQPKETLNVENLEIVETAPKIPETEIFADSDVLNILIIGTDERSKDFSVNARSDCMILASIDKENNTVKLVSLERGIAAPILEGGWAGGYDWLTHIFRYGGAELLRKTVEHCFKVEVDHYVRFNFTAVQSVIDVIGGVEIELTDSEAWALNQKRPHRSMGNGVNYLDGHDALLFARLRSIDSDWKRVERQRKVILAAVDALKGSDLTTLIDLMNEILPMVQTNLTKLEIAELMFYAPNLLNATFDQMTIPKQGTYGGLQCIQDRVGFAVDYEINNEILRRFLYEGATSKELLSE